MASININGKNREFDKIYYFSPKGSDINNNQGTMENPFKTPSGAINSGVLNNPVETRVCFYLFSGVYSDFKYWFNTNLKSLPPNLDLSVIGESGEFTIINGSNILQLSHHSASAIKITISNVSIYWNDIDNAGLVNIASNNLPATTIVFSNVLLKIGKMLDSTKKWYFLSGIPSQISLNIENSILTKHITFLDNSLDLASKHTNIINITNTLLSNNLNIGSLNTSLVRKDNSLILDTIPNDYWHFPISNAVSHKGKTGILNPDGGISHIGLCGGANAWYYDTYWYKFSDSTEYNGIPLTQVKQHYSLNYLGENHSLNNQIEYLEDIIVNKGNKVTNLAVNSVGTYDFINLINSPKIASYIIDENLLGVYDVDNIHSVEFNIDTPFYTNYKQYLVYKNGVILTENSQYIVNGNKIIVTVCNIGDEISIYNGWKNFNCNLHIVYKRDELDNVTKYIDKIICEDVSVASQYDYDNNNKIVSQSLSYNDNIVQVRDYIYNKDSELTEVLIRNKV